MGTWISNLPKVVDINKIEVSKDRRPVAFSDAQQMAASIREHGLIQPIVLARIPGDEHAVGERYLLVAGAHRLAGLRIIGRQFLKHFEDYVVRGEDANTDEGKLRLSAVELEENLRRKNLEWHEVIEAKAKLLELMEAIHGQTGPGCPTRSEARTGEIAGFGVRKLAAMLGESPSLVSQDLQLAKMVRAMPALKTQETKSAASRIGTLGVAIELIKQGQAKAASASASASSASASTAVEEAKRYELYQGRWQDSISLVPDNSVDLIYTDLPYGVNLNEMSSHQKGAMTYNDPRFEVVDSLSKMMVESYRILKEARYAMFWFGFNYYRELLDAIDDAGFSYNPVPVVWIKHRQSTENPLSRYANGYEQALVCWKGSAKFVRPGQANVVDIPGVASGDKVQNAQQPIQLVERFIGDMVLTNCNGRILDFTAGSGTTGVAALKLGCYPILFERDKDQCLILEQRLRNAKANVTGMVNHTENRMSTTASSD